MGLNSNHPGSGYTRRLAGLVLALATAAATAADRRTPVVEAVQKALPSVVNIGTERMVRVMRSDSPFSVRDDLIDRVLRDFSGPVPQPDYQVRHSLGSGVIIDPRGYILTNYHVIERATAIRVTLTEDRQYTARFIAGDELNDLALIKIDPREPLQAIAFAEPDDLLLGETIIVLGNPFGLAHTVTVGVLSAMNREARYGTEVLFRDILQTDAAVNPGSSGGPLLNIDGDLIGINVAIYQEAQNIGFALPVKRIQALLAVWLDPGELSNLWLGFTAEDTAQGVAVQAVDDAGPAWKTDLLPGDRIRAVNGQPVGGRLALYRAMIGLGPGDRVAFTVERGGNTHDVAYALEERLRPSGESLALQRLGIVFGNAETRSTRIRTGLPIDSVTADGAADRIGLKPGYLVMKIGDREINTLDDVAAALEKVHSGDALPLVVATVEDRTSFVIARTATARLKAD